MSCLGFSDSLRWWAGDPCFNRWSECLLVNIQNDRHLAKMSHCLPSVDQKQNPRQKKRVKGKQARDLPFTKNLLGSEAALSKSSSLVIKLSRSNITSVATSQKVNDWNRKQFRETIIRLGSCQVGSQLKLHCRYCTFQRCFSSFPTWIINYVCTRIGSKTVNV